MNENEKFIGIQKAKDKIQQQNKNHTKHNEFIPLTVRIGKYIVGWIIIALAVETLNKAKTTTEKREVKIG